MVLAGSGLGFLTSPKSEVRSPKSGSPKYEWVGRERTEEERRATLQERRLRSQNLPGGRARFNDGPSPKSQSPESRSVPLEPVQYPSPRPRVRQQHRGPSGAPASPSPSSQVPSPESQVRKSQVRKSQVRNRLVRAAPALQSEVRKSEVRNRPPSS